MFQFFYKNNVFLRVTAHSAKTRIPEFCRCVCLSVSPSVRLSQPSTDSSPS